MRLACCAALSLAIGSLGCSRADVYAITAEAAASGQTAGGAAGSANGGASGQAGEGGTPPSCARGELVPGDTSQSVMVDGMSRSFLLHVPDAYAGAMPAALIVDFHGQGSTAQEERDRSPYPARVDTEGVLMAFPVGLKGSLGLSWNVGPCCLADVDDVAFARAVVTRIEQLGCVDPKRVYAIGTLTGGGMAHYVACHAADVFAAAAPAAFDLLVENEAECTPARPISVATFRGTDDSRVPYAGGPSSLVPGMPITFLGAQGSFEKWAEIDGCSGTPSAADASGCSSYTTCAGGAEVMLCTKQGGREEPGDPGVAWPFFERHTL